MRSAAWLLLMAGCTVSGSALAETCFNDDGFVVDCATPGNPKVTSRFSQLPNQAGIPQPLWISGGAAITGNGGFTVRINGQFLCSTGDHAPGFSPSTPVRMCTVTIPSPGTYVFDAIPDAANNWKATPMQVWTVN